MAPNPASSLRLWTHRGEVEAEGEVAEKELGVKGNLGNRAPGEAPAYSPQG